MPAVGHERLGEEVVHRQQLDGGHPQVVEVAGDGAAAEPGVRPAQLLGDLVVQPGEALDVQLVDDRVAPPGAQLGVALPVELVVHDDRPGDRGGRVAVVALERVGGAVGQRERSGGHLARDRPGVRVQEQLGGVEPTAVGGVPGPVDAEAVALADRDAGQLPVPHAERVLGQLVPGLGPRPVEEADPGRGALGRPDGEVGGLGRPRRAELLVVARPDGGGLVVALPTPAVAVHRPIQAHGPRGARLGSGGPAHGASRRR